MKKIILIIVTTLFFLAGCGKQIERFDDHKVQISLLSSQNLGNTITYSIRLKNNGNFTMKDTIMYLSYPKKVANGTQGNPFKVEAKVTSGNQNLIKPSDEVVFQVIAPVGDFFDTTTLDIDHPYIEFRGFQLTTDKKEIPFGMIGNYLNK